MSFTRQITTRTTAQADAPDPRSISASLQEANRSPVRQLAWAEQFMKDAGVADLSVSDAVAIMYECDTYEAATGRLSQMLAAGQGLAAARPAAQADTAARIIASHAKAHQPTGRIHQS